MTQTGSISPNLLFRTLRRDEASRLGSIDRAEHVDAVYRMRHGELVLEEQVEEISGWAPDELTAYVARLEELLDADGLALGAWEADGLIGLASLDLRPVGGDPTRMKLDMLYVSAGRRGHGIGRRLVEQLATQARSLGATGGWGRDVPHDTWLPPRSLMVGAVVIAPGADPPRVVAVVENSKTYTQLLDARGLADLERHLDYAQYLDGSALVTTRAGRVHRGRQPPRLAPTNVTSSWPSNRTTAPRCASATA